VTAIELRTDTVLLDVEDGIATIAMNQPERRNSFTIEMTDGIVEALERAEMDPSARVVVLTSTGDHWGVGRDNSGGPPAPYPPGDFLKGRPSLMRFTRMITQLHDMNTPVIAEVKGGCAGAGMSLALSADLRYTPAPRYQPSQARQPIVRSSESSPTTSSHPANSEPDRRPESIATSPISIRPVRHSSVLWGSADRVEAAA